MKMIFVLTVLVVAIEASVVIKHQKEKSEIHFGGNETSLFGSEEHKIKKHLKDVIKNNKGSAGDCAWTSMRDLFRCIEGLRRRGYHESSDCEQSRRGFIDWWKRSNDVYLSHVFDSDEDKSNIGRTGIHVNNQDVPRNVTTCVQKQFAYFIQCLKRKPNVNRNTLREGNVKEQNVEKKNNTDVKDEKKDQLQVNKEQPQRVSVDHLDQLRHTNQTL